MFRKFKFPELRVVLASLFLAASSVSSFGYLTRQEAFEQTFDMVWSTVQESYWDETFGGLDWAAVRNTYKPRLSKVDNRRELVELLQAMLNELKLSHYKVLSSYIEPIDNYPRGGSVGLFLKYADGKAFVTQVTVDSPADEAGIKIGWRLKAIHRKSLSRLIRPFKKMDQTEKRNTFFIQRYLNSLIQGAPGREIRTDWYPPKGRAKKTYMVPEPDTREISDSVGYMPSQKIEFTQRYLEGDILYMRFNYFLPSLMTDIRTGIQTAAEKAEGIIIDLRSNPGGLSIMATGITGLLVDEPTTLGTLSLKNGYIAYQGYPQAKRYRGPVAILIDGASVSTSEMLAAGLQEAGRARIFGEPSLGESLPSLFKKLPSGDVFQYAVGDFLTPDGYRIEKNGVIPDELIEPSDKDLEMGLDLPLQKASEWIRSQSVPNNDTAR